MGDKKIRLLFVEDDKVDQMAFVRFIKDEKLPYEYSLAGSVAESKKLIASKDFDIAIADYMLGDGTLFDLFDLLKDIPVIVTTGVGDEEIAVNAMKSGAYDYLPKDSECRYLSTLPFTVESAVNHRETEKELENHRESLESLIKERTAELEAEITDRVQAEVKLRKSENELKIRNQIDYVFLTCPDETMYAEVLNIVLRVMQSNYGVFGFIDEKGSLVCPSMTTTIWDQCEMTGKDIVFHPETWAGIWGKAMLEKKPRYANRPFKVPKGHLPISRALDVPIVHQGKLVGNLLVDNKAIDYDNEDKRLLVTIARYISPILNAKLQKEREETSRRRAQVSLKKSETKYKTLTQNIPGMIYMGASDWSANIVSGSRALCGYTAAEINSQQDNWLSIVHPDDQEAVYRDGSELAIESNDCVQVYRIITKNGDIRWVEDRKTSLFTENGDLIGIDGIVLDITERKNSEKNLTESMEKYRSLVESTRDSIYLVDADCRYQFINQRHLSRFGLPAEKVLGKQYGEFHSSDETGSFKAKIDEIIRTGESLSHQYLSERDGGYFLRTLSPVKGPDDRTTAVTVTSKDITDQKMAELRLKNSQAQLRNLSAHLQSSREQERMSIARQIHDEIGQLLTALKMDTRWLEKRLAADPSQLVKKLNSMTRLLDRGITSVQRISSELRPGLLDDLGIAAAIEWQLKEHTERSGIPHSFFAEPEDIALNPELATTVFRIFQEALTNINRHADATMITVNLSEEDGLLKMTVADNGKGINTEQISNLQSFGLLGMRERARYFNGMLTIRGIPRKGTRINLIVPVKRGNFP